MAIAAKAGAELVLPGAKDKVAALAQTNILLRQRRQCGRRAARRRRAPRPARASLFVEK